MKFTSILATVAIFSAATMAAPWGPGWQKAHAHDVSRVAPPPPPAPIKHYEAPEPEESYEPEQPYEPYEPEQPVTHHRQQSIDNVGNEGRVGGVFNNFFKGGIASDNGVNNKVSQGSAH
ncbi:hypothetical protein BDF14DRAFT_1957511 [Spinellus fusiger]|nr:hypothetical protein BDF14DRAFT_1957511 [Spinellus fusiger]